MVSPSPIPSRPLQDAPPARTGGERVAPGHFLRSYAFQLFALLLGIALAFL